MNRTKRDDPGAVTVTVEGLIKHETEKALLVRAVGMDKDKWVAKSQLQRDTVPLDGGLFIIFVPTWLAKANSWNYDDYDPEDFEIKDISDYDEVPLPPGSTVEDLYDDDIPF